MKYDVSICMPAHRTHLWDEFYESAAKAVGPYSWEMILVGPNDPSESLSKKPNFKFFKDYGHPARCAQIATTLAEGELMMWGSDDGIWQPNSIRECISLHKEHDEKDVIIIRYSEGVNFTGKLPPDDYWKPWTHPDQRLPGIPKEFWCAPVGMYNLNFFRELGGWDCRFEHLNMCCHDLAFRAQRAGGKVRMSPNLVLSCNWNPGVGDHIPVQEAYHANDAPLFAQLYGQNQDDRIKIDYFNWTKAPAVWSRRFKR